MVKRFSGRFDKRERSWGPECSVLANGSGGGYDGSDAVIAREAEMAGERETAQDKHGREGVAKVRMGDRRRERKSRHGGEFLGLFDRQI